MAPRICKLCKHPRVVAINKFMEHGATYAEFRKKFGLRSINVWCWSRHKTHIAAIVESPPSATPAPENSLLDSKKLADINKRLEILARRSEKTGRANNAIQAYSQLAKNLTTLAEFNKEQAKVGAGAAPQPIFNIVFKNPTSRAIEELAKDLFHIVGEDGERVFATDVQELANIARRYDKFRQSTEEEEPQIVRLGEVGRAAAPVDPEADLASFDRAVAERKEREAEELKEERQKRAEQQRTATAMETWVKLGKDEKPN